MSLMDRLRLSLLYGREQALGRQIGAGYARGDHKARLRAEQNEVRGQIAALEKEMGRS